MRLSTFSALRRDREHVVLPNALPSGPAIGSFCLAASCTIYFWDVSFVLNCIRLPRGEEGELNYAEIPRNP
jgi:hypothetical protein